jgi:RNA polymerase sigma-70 factor (ECF subfamily)
LTTYFCFTINLRIITPSTLHSDPELIAQWQQGNELAFKALYEKYAFYLVNRIAGKVRDIDVAKDLVQDLMMQVYLNKDRLEIHTTFKGYLLAALRNRLFNYKRDVLRKEQRLLTATIGDLGVDAVTETVDHKDVLQQIQQIIAKLPDQCRQVFLLRREGNLTNQQVADKLGISVKTVEAHMSKALKFLKANLEYLVWLGIVGGM